MLTKQIYTESTLGNVISINDIAYPVTPMLVSEISSGEIPVVNIVEFSEHIEEFTPRFVGNGAEGICIRINNLERRPLVLKLFYGIGLPNQIAKSILSTLPISKDGIFWNRNNQNSWNSSLDWHINALSLSHPARTPEIQSRLTAEILCAIAGNQIAPHIIDKPVALIENEGSIQGYVTEFYKGSFCPIINVASCIQGELQALKEAGISLDYSQYGNNAVILSEDSHHGAGIRLFDLG